MSNEEARQQPARPGAADAVTAEERADTVPPSQQTVDGEVVLQSSDEELYRQLVAEVEGLTDRIRALDPTYRPPPFSPKGLVALLEDLLSRFPRDVQLGLVERLRGALSREIFDPEVWKGV